jgi:hypothetical protein
MAIPSQDLTETKKWKTCSRCRRKQSVSEYYRLKTGRDGLHPECKACVKKRTSAYRRAVNAPLDPAAIAKKRCRDCDCLKPYTGFYSTGTSRGALGVMALCKECFNAQQREARKDPEIRQRGLDYARSQRVILRDKSLNAYGAKCACCGEAERRFLSLDHIHNDGAEWRKKTFGKRHMAGYRTYLWLVANDFPKGVFQVLCANCQFGKRMNKGICPHQLNKV